MTAVLQSNLLSVLSSFFLLTGCFTTLSSLVTAFPQNSLQPLWEDLASTDGVKAYRAIWTMTSTPGASVAFLCDRVKPLSAPDPKQVAQLISNLNSNSFPVRDKAARELEQLAEQAAPHLTQSAARKDLPLEMKRRLEALLRRVKDRALT